LSNRPMVWFPQIYGTDPDLWLERITVIVLSNAQSWQSSGGQKL